MGLLCGWCVWWNISWSDKMDDQISKKTRHILFSVLFPKHFVHVVFSPILAERLKTLPHIPYICLKYSMCKGSSRMIALSAPPARRVTRHPVQETHFAVYCQPNTPAFCWNIVFSFFTSGATQVVCTRNLLRCFRCHSTHPRLKRDTP